MSSTLALFLYKIKTRIIMWKDIDMAKLLICYTRVNRSIFRSEYRIPVSSDRIIDMKKPRSSLAT